MSEEQNIIIQDQLKTLLAENRLDHRVLKLLIDHETKENQTDAAIKHLEDLLKGFPDDWKNMNQLAGIYMQTEYYAEASKWYSRSLEINADQKVIAKRLQRLSWRVTSAERTPILSPSRILLITNLYPPQELGGYGRSMYSFAEELRKRGHDVTVLTAYQPSLGERPDDPPHVVRDIKLFGDWQDGAITHYPNKEQLIADNIKTVTGAIKKYAPDFILMGNLDLIHTDIIAPVLDLFSIPVIHHLGFTDNHFPGKKVPVHPNYTFIGASRWVMENNIPAGYANCDYVYPGADTRKFRLSSAISTRKLKIAYAGLVTESKGVGTLINALSILKQRGIDFSCSIAGKQINCNFYSNLENICRLNQIDSQIDFTGNLNSHELLELYASHNILVFPSIFPEAFGITPVEAMAAGLPVISTGAGGAAEVVEDGVSGIITRPEDHEQLAEALISLQAAPDRWSSMAAAAQQWAIEMFDITVSVDKLEKIFSRL